MQTDCNLVLYDSQRGLGGYDPSAATWASGTWVSGGAICNAQVQTNGLLAVFRAGITAPVYTVTLSPGSVAFPITDAASAVIYVIQDDGNFVAYQCQAPYWASNTYTPGAGFLQMTPSLNPDFVPPQFLVDGFKNKCFGDDPVACADAANDELGFIEFPSVSEN